MASRMGVSTLVISMFLSGCANSLLSKYQDKECVENCSADSPYPRLDFEQPVWQTLNMFIGELLCAIPLIWGFMTAKPKADKDPQASVFTRILSRIPLGTASTTTPNQYAPVLGEDDSSEDGDEEDDHARWQQVDNSLSGWRMGLMWFPAFFDICGTTLMNVGLILTPVSIYSMSKGVLVLWVGVLSVIFLGRRLWLYQWASLVTVTLGVCLVGLSGSLVKKELNDLPSDQANVINAFANIARRGDDDPAKVALGVILILFAQVFTASQFVIEEKIMARYKVEPLAAVSLEGFFGLITTLAAMPLLHVFLHDKSPYFDIPRGWHQIVSTPTVLGSCFAIMFSIGAYNFFGLSVTRRVSATTRSTIDTCRTLGIWIVSLGLGWERLVWPFTVLQVIGFAMLVYGTFVFNGLISPPFFAPPPNVHLPHEPELEETAEVPAAREQSRAGYDIVPDHER